MMDSQGDISGSGWLHSSSFCLAFNGQGSFHICLTKSVSGMLRCAHTKLRDVGMPSKNQKMMILSGGSFGLKGRRQRCSSPVIMEFLDTF